MKKEAGKWVSLFFALTILFGTTGPISMANTLLPGTLVPDMLTTGTLEADELLPVTLMADELTTGTLEADELLPVTLMADELIIPDEDTVAQAAGSFKALTVVTNGVSSSIFRMADWEAIKGRAFINGVMLDGFTNQNVNLCTFGIEYNVLKAMEISNIKKVTLMTDSCVVTFPPDAFAGILSDFLTGKTSEAAGTAIVFFDMKRLTALEAFPTGMPDKQKSAYTADNPVYSSALRIAVTDGGVETAQTVSEQARFDKQAVLSWPYSPKAGVNTDKLTAWHLSADGSTDNTGGRYNDQSGLFQVMVSRFGFHTVASATVSYKDAGTHWAAGMIHRLSAMGVISGKNGNFRPNTQLTRAEFSKMIVLARKLSITGVTSQFTDVEEGDWFNKYVAAAVADGFISGNTDSTFAPSQFITRQEMAVMMHKALSGDAPAVDFNPLVFEDEASIADSAYDSVVIVSELGIMNGKSGIAKGPAALVFDPTGFVTRGETAAVVYRFLDYLIGD